MVEVNHSGDEPVKGRVGGIPALFAEVENPYVAVAAQPAPAHPVTPSYAQAQAAYGTPPASLNGSFGYGQPAPDVNGFGQPQPGVEVNGFGQPTNAGYQSGGPANPPNAVVSPDQVLSPPLPMGYYEGTANLQPVQQAQPAEKFLLPTPNLDKVVSEILTPFGFDEQIVPPPPPPPPPPESLTPPPAYVPHPYANHPQMVPPPPLDPLHGTGFGMQAANAAHSVGELPPPPPPLPVDAGPPPEPGVYPGIPTPPAPAAVSAPPPVAAPAPVPQMTPEEAREADRRIAMAELAREVMGAADSEGVRPENGDITRSADVEEPDVADQEEARAASFDLVIGPAHKIGKRRRSKPPISTERFLDPEGLQPNGDYGQPAAPANPEKTRSKGRLRLRS